MGLQAQEMDIGQRPQGGQVHAGLFLSDKDEIPLGTGLGRMDHPAIFNAALQRTDKAQNGPFQRLKLLGHGSRLSSLGEQFKVGAVGNEGSLGISGFQPLAQAVSGGKDHVTLGSQIHLHLVHQLRIHQAAICRMAVHTVIDQCTVWHMVHQIGTDRRISPQNGLVKPVAFHHFSDIGGHPLLIQPVNPTILIEKRQYRRQGVNRNMVRHLFTRLAVSFTVGQGAAVLDGRNDGHRRVKIQHLGVMQAAHNLLFSCGNGIPRRRGQTDDLFHGSSNSVRATSSFSAARTRRCSMVSGASRPSANASAMEAMSRSVVTSSRSI